MLLHFLRWLERNGNRPFSTLFAEGGELLTEFAATGNTRVASDSRWCPGGIRSQAMGALGLTSLSSAAERADLRGFAVGCRPGLVYLNGFHSANFRLVELLDLGVPIVTHVHELGLLFRAQAGSAMPRMLSRTHRFIACSGAVKNNLIREHRVEASRIEVAHGFISVGDVQAQRSREHVLRELGFPIDAVVVVGCGTVAWNKGTDVFVRLAQTVCKERDRARFVWIGNGFGWDIPQHEHDVAMLGLAEKVRFIGHVTSPADYISAADIFALTSRQDSFPLVGLEAAALGKPIVCFAEGGGIPEFVEHDCGFVVSYLDVAAMSDRVICLLDSPESRLEMGEAARRKVATRNDISNAAPRIAKIIDALIDE